MITREKIEFVSHGKTLRGELFKPESKTAHDLPGVVLAHGWGMTAGGNLADYANVIASRNIIAMTFDFRNLGNSDGLPRQDLNPYDQIEDFRNAVAFMSTLEFVDPRRIGVWGSSYSGGHALVLGAVEPLVKCVVSQVPTIDGTRAAQITLRPKAIMEQQQWFAEDRQNVLKGMNPRLVKSVSLDKSEWVVFGGKDAYEFMMNDGQRSFTWRNETTLRSLEWARAYIPGSFISRIAPKPLLMIVADNDGTTPTSLQLEAFEQALEPKKLKMISGGHYAPYVDQFTNSSSAAADWFEEHL